MRKYLIGAAALAAVSTAALATITFDASTGTGFVGKGDVQFTYGWNNKTLQDKAAGVTFSYLSEETFDVTCEWDTGREGTPGFKHHSVTTPKKRGINAVINGDPRQVKGQTQFTGFILSGFGEVSYTGGPTALPTVGAACPNGGDGLITAVVSLGESAGALYVSDAGATPVLLLEKPVIIP